MSAISRRREAALLEGGAAYAAKRNELVRVAATLFKDRGYRSTTLSDIAQGAGVDRATIYYYVGSKEELLREAVRGLLDENVLKAEKLARGTLSPREKLESIVQLLMLSYDRNYPYAYVYIQQEMHRVADTRSPWAKEMAGRTRRFEKAVRSIIQEGMESGVFRDDVPVDLAANAMFGAVNWTHRWYNPGGRYSPEAVADAFCKVVLQGLLSRRLPHLEENEGVERPATGFLTV